MWKVIATWDNFKTVRNSVSGCKHGEFASRKTTEKVFTRWVDAVTYQRNCEMSGNCFETKLIKSD